MGEQTQLRKPSEAKNIRWARVHLRDCPIRNGGRWSMCLDCGRATEILTFCQPARAGGSHG